MKKTVTILISLAIIAGCSNSLKAQNINSGEINAGVGMMYSNESSQLGFKIDGKYKINEQYRIIADIGIFFPNKTDFGGGASLKVTWWELNLNGNYLFFESEEQKLTAYAIGGLSFFTRIIDVDNPRNNAKKSTTFPGLNAGAGMEFGLDFAVLFTEIKYTLSLADQLHFGAGLRFPIFKN